MICRIAGSLRFAFPFPSLRFRLTWDGPGRDEDGRVLMEGGVGAPLGDGSAVWLALEEASGVALDVMDGESMAGGSRKVPGAAVVGA